ncbi:hypothetical protein BJV74DRAFT_882954 [Russula compacta]|nr:hypothetical protein BJV74DRAFT_882954 [Russula compacta]
MASRRWRNVVLGLRQKEHVKYVLRAASVRGRTLTSRAPGTGAPSVGWYMRLPSVEWELGKIGSLLIASLVLATSPSMLPLTLATSFSMLRFGHTALSAAAVDRGQLPDTLDLAVTLAVGVFNNTAATYTLGFVRGDARSLHNDEAKLYFGQSPRCHQRSQRATASDF